MGSGGVPMSYHKYGISDDLVYRVKKKMKNPATKERMKRLLEGVTKYDLQNRATVRRLLDQASAILHEPLTGQQKENIVSFVIAQKIDPQNTLHLLRLWSMFR
jgi:RAB protein geranylgeranyltransferase component A